MAITDWEQRGIPGLLQTEAYARAAVRACRPYMTPEALEERIRARLERQEVFTRDRPPKFWAVASEVYADDALVLAGQELPLGACRKGILD